MFEGSKPQRKPRQYLGLILRGACMGACDLVPGVSGGTMAFLLEIYEELIDSIRTLGRPEFLGALFSFRLREAWQMLNWRFLLAVGTGIALAILSLARLVEYLITSHPVLLWSFFFGLVLASVISIGSHIRRWTPPLAIGLLLGTVVAYIVVGMVPLQTPEDAWFLILSGAIAICAMILPGISGSFILVLLGKYEFILSAVNNRDILSILYVGIGAVVGIILFAQILGWFFHRYHDITVAALTGLMLGSLRKVWPWKVESEWAIINNGERVVTGEANVLPNFNIHTFYALAVMVVGFVLVLLLHRWVHQKRNS